MNLLTLNHEKMGKIRVKFFRKWLIVASQTSLFWGQKKFLMKSFAEKRDIYEAKFQVYYTIVHFFGFWSKFNPLIFFFTRETVFCDFSNKKRAIFFSEKSFSASKGINGCDKWLRFHAQKKLIPKKIHLPHSSTVWSRKKTLIFCSTSSFITYGSI